jgi:6,7-dimethyl-8-ribityllumazine synthase
MSAPLEPRPRLLGRKHRITIVASAFNQVFADALLDSTVRALEGISQQHRIEILRVPGAAEIPVTVAATLEHDPPHCVIALGVIMRGDTGQADLIAQSVYGALQQLSVKHRHPVINEVLLVDDEKQAYARCIGKTLNRGEEAAKAAIAMMELFSTRFDRASQSVKRHLKPNA